MRPFLSLVLLGFGLVASTAIGQTTQPEIAARLVKKPLYLRGRWSDKKLKFLADGSAKEPYKARSFTVSGFDARSVTLKDDMLRIDGKRMGLEFDERGGMRRAAMAICGSRSMVRPERTLARRWMPCFHPIWRA